MELLYKKIVIALLSTVGIFCLSQGLIKKALDRILADIKELDPKGAEQVEKRSKRLGYIVKIVAGIECAFFASFTIWFFQDGKITDPEIGNLLNFFAG